MRKILILFLLLPCFTSGQVNISDKYKELRGVLESDTDVEKLYLQLKELESISSNDSIYPYILSECITTASALESNARMIQEWNKAVEYGLDILDYTQKGKLIFNPEFAAMEAWNMKNLIVSYFGLDKLEEAKRYRDQLYVGYKNKTLPDGIDEYFNFDFFKWKDRNIWGYEWYPQLGDPETEGSFTKIVYYVYSTHDDGSDKDQLYRLHVLKFHKSGNSVPFDYVLTMRTENPDSKIKGATLYDYTYTKDIDYLKLRSDVKEVLGKLVIE